MNNLFQIVWVLYSRIDNDENSASSTFDWWMYEIMIWEKPAVEFIDLLDEVYENVYISSHDISFCSRLAKNQFICFDSPLIKSHTQ